jgi:HAE1 family hydrophobic/amphiphilic exporter-1
MNFTSLFIRRPVMTTLVMVAILFFGIMAYQRLPVNDLPVVDYPTITVSASLPGASPETMASAVATPLEKQFSTIAGIDNMTSTSVLGSTTITVQFVLDRDIDAAAQDVQSAISKTLRDLPPGIVPPSMQKTNPADQPILYLALTSSTLPLSDLDEYGETFMAQRISTVSGVAQVAVYGSQKYATRIQLDPRALASRGLGIDEVADAVTAGNVNLPSGILWGPNRAYTVDARGQLKTAKEFGELTVAYRNGAPVKLKDIGNVLDDVQNNRVAAWFNGVRSVTLAIQRQPGTNTVAVATAVKELLPKLQAQIPPSVSVNVFYDRSLTIQASVKDVKETLLLTLVLVVLVIFLFLRNLSATVIPSLALPMSLVGTFTLMWALGYSLDNLSLMALTLAVGFVVDDAIVMLENIVRHMEMGKAPMQAAYDGAAEIGFTILSMTISLTAVFIPLLFMGGIVGRLFHEFAVTIGVAILVSGVISLTLTPMLSSRFLKSGLHSHSDPVAAGRKRSVFDLFERGYEASLSLYQRTLGWAMQHRRTTMVFSLLTLIGTGVLFRLVPKGFLPNEDQGRISGVTETAQGTSYDALVSHQKEVAAILQKDPSVEAILSFVGMGGGVSTNNQGRVSMRLKPREDRPPAEEVQRRLSRAVSGIPGISVFLQMPPSINIGGRPTKSLYQYSIQGSDLNTLYASSNAMLAKMKTIPELIDVTSDLLITNPQVSITIDRDRASALGVTAEQIETALYNAYGSRQVSTIYTPTNEYWVIMEVLPEFQLGPNALDLLYIRSNRGSLVPLSAVTRMQSTAGPLTVSHTGQVPSVTISFNLREGASLGDAVRLIEEQANTTLGEGVSAGFYGTAQAFQDTQQGLLALLVIAIFVIYIVLGILYESFIHPLTILSGIPFAAFGALVALLVCHVELSVYAFVGVIMLVGLVKKNAIMMIDYAIEVERRDGKRAAEAILEACRVRFRPIMMTTMAALAGTLPIALGAGAGAESRRPLGIAVVGGLAFSQLITLYITPVVYTYLDQFQRRFSKKKAAPVVVTSEVVEPELVGR